jgi:LmeA-like phospholipid-binding
MSDERRLEEQVVSQAVQAGLSSQLDRAEAVEVEVRTDVLKAVQGQVDSVTVSGQGVVMQEVRVQELEVRTEGVAIDPLSALLGNLKLSQPVNASTRVVLTEADLNQAMNSEIVLRLLPALKLTVAGAIVEVELVPPLQAKLPGDHKIYLEGAALLHEEKGTRKVEFTTTIVPRRESQSILIEGFECQPGAGIALEFAIALLQKFQHLTSQPTLEFAGVTFQVQRLEVAAGSLSVETAAVVSQIPTL